jgi:hypothetical protein
MVHYRPATEIEAGTAGAGGRQDHYSRAIPIAQPARAETLFRSADLQARQLSADTGPVPRAAWADPTDPTDD